MAKNKSLSGVTCNIYKAKNEIEHFHQDIEINYVIEGRVKIVIENNEFIIATNEILLINSNKSHYAHVLEDALMCRINISYDLLTEQLGEDYIAFWCNMLTEGDTGYSELCNIFKEIILLKLDDNRKDSFRLLERYSRMVNILIRDFKISSVEWSNDSTDNDAERVKQVINYINMNFQESISLQAMADRLFVSVSTLSRVFKKVTSEKFPDYVNRVRMQHAVNDLLNTNKSMTDIAIENGFSSPSTFNRVFKEMYNTSPSLYKKSMRSESVGNITSLTTEDEEQIRHRIENKDIAEIKTREKPLVDIYLGEQKEFKRISNRAISAGAFFQLTGSIVQQQIRRMVIKLGLDYVRAWNVFSPKTMIADSPDDKELNFEYINAALDFLISINVHPILDITERPECLIKSGRELFYKKNDGMGFRTIEQWLYFVDKFMDHVVFRYGRQEVSKWIIEIGALPPYEKNEMCCNNDYVDIFCQSYKTIKSHCKEIKVGGANWVFDGTDVDLEPYFSGWRKSGIFPDFYSVFLFPYRVKDNYSDDFYRNKERNMDPDFLENVIHEVHKQLKAVDAPKRPLIISEMSTILSNRNAMNDHCSRATSAVKVTNLYQDYVDMICFWVATDRVSLRYAPPSILHGGSGLVSKDGIPKPTLFALYFMNKLGSKLLGRGEGYIATETSHNEVYILCYNHKTLQYKYRYVEEQQVTVYNVDDMFIDKDDLTLKFMLHGLEIDGEYVIKRHIINQENGSVMDEWEKLGYEPEMRSNDIDYLTNICVPRIQMGHRIAEEGQIYLEATLKAHEMQLIHVYRYTK